jgi:hypothetical protein
MVQKRAQLSDGRKAVFQYLPPPAAMSRYPGAWRFPFRPSVTTSAAFIPHSG